MLLLKVLVVEDTLDFIMILSLRRTLICPLSSSKTCSSLQNELKDLQVCLHCCYYCYRYCHQCGTMTTEEDLSRIGCFLTGSKASQNCNHFACQCFSEVILSILIILFRLPYRMSTRIVRRQKFEMSRISALPNLLIID